MPEPRTWDLIDPQEPVSDRWFAASGFETVSRPSEGHPPVAERRADLDRADAITLEAATPGALRPASLRAALHLLAVELRREAGAWTECRENFSALARHYVDVGERRTANAYVEKLLFVAEFSGVDAIRVEAYEFAASLLIELKMVDRAKVLADKASELAQGCTDEELVRRVADLATRFEEASVGKRLGRRMQPAWAPEPAPLEFRFRGVPVDPAGIRYGWSSASFTPGSGLDLAMRKPDGAGECRYWVSHRVSAGRTHVIVLPNWSGRAMQAAKAMVDLSRANQEDTAAPSSAILQVSCALEAFINSVVHFIRSLDEHCWTGTDLPEYCQRSYDIKDLKIPTSTMWTDVALSLFGQGWATPELMKEFKLLYEIRDVLVHFKGGNEEEILEEGSKAPEIFRKIEKLKLHTRPGPAAWIDRALTPELAGWAVTVGEGMIAAFRNAWEARDEARARDALEAADAGMPDIALERAIMEPDPEDLRRQDALVARFLERSRLAEARRIAGLGDQTIDVATCP